MNRRIIAIFWLAAAPLVLFGQNSGFVENLSSQELQSTGLDKLTGAERAALDELVARRFSGAHVEIVSTLTSPPVAISQPSPQTVSPSVVASTPQAAQLPPAPPRNPPELEEPSARAVTKRASEASSASEGGGWLNWIKPRNPKKEVAVIESQISGQLHGWDSHTVFTLANGQRWTVSDYSIRSFVHPLDSPKVKIIPTSIFGYVLEIPEVDLRIHVRPVN